MLHRRGITIIEVLVVVGVLVVAAALLLSVLGGPSRSIPLTMNGTQIRSIHQGIVIFSQAHNDFYLGRKEDGSLAPQADVAWRLRTLIEANYFATEYAQSPDEPTPAAGYSYDMVSLADSTGQRFDGWRNTTNGGTPIVTDRLASGTPGKSATYRSIHTETSGIWQGGVAYNDDHVNFETKAVLFTNDGKNNHPNDDIFAAESADDTLMVYSGT